MTTTTAQPAQPGTGPRGVAQARSLFDREILAQAGIDAFKKLDPGYRSRIP